MQKPRNADFLYGKNIGIGEVLSIIIFRSPPIPARSCKKMSSTFLIPDNIPLKMEIKHLYLVKSHKTRKDIRQQILSFKKTFLTQKLFKHGILNGE